MDKLNSLSYAYHYRSLDSTEYYARQAQLESEAYADGHAEALNNLAFVRIAQMRYEEARLLLNQIPHTTDNQLELLIGYIQQMRLCQRMSDNRAFYDYREQALRAQRRIDEERATLDERQLQRLIYAESELAIVTSTYYYYVGLERQSAQALENMPDELERDTAQWLNYLYNVGSGGMITQGTQEEINQAEFDHLMRCFLLARQKDIAYFTANSLEALAEHLMVSEYREQLKAGNLPAFTFINPDNIPDDSLALSLAFHSLDIFEHYGDVYQIAGAHRTLASCWLQLQDYSQALYHLEQALADTIINKAPDLVASIREQLSVAYAAIDDKPNSDLNRNLYLAKQEETRQDRSLEARAGQLEHTISQLNMLLVAVVAAIVLLILLLWMSFYRYKFHDKNNEDAQAHQHREEQEEQLALARLHVEKGERINLEQRARISMVNSIMPFIDRILHEARMLSTGNDDVNAERVEYIRELTDKINEQNDILTHWIQLRQGELSLHIETFPLQPLFDIVAMNRRSFSMKGINLTVTPTETRVKADRVLTLFMLNTLADNARKFTSQGGEVSISAAETDDYVEISVRDNGVGMDPDQLAHIFERKVITDDIHQHSPDRKQQESSHGYGLLNCKGIIDKYRKLSRIFSVCTIQAESSTGSGSRFFFRLPKGIGKALGMLVAVFLCHFFPTSASADAIDSSENIELSVASAFADSVYHSNLSGTYPHSLSLADSCRVHLNRFYKQHRPYSADTLLQLGDPSVLPPEIIWLRDSIHINYDILLSLRNESAVAALALHEWALYQYNNRIYTQLFKEHSADNTLGAYCRKMQQSQANKQIAILLLLLLFVSILIAVAWQVTISMRRAASRQQALQAQFEITADEIQRAELDEARLHVSNAVLDNCLSTLKHETMYYPSRIRQLVDSGDTDSLTEVVAYYRELYSILSMQALKQTESHKLHLKPLDHEILGDPVLISYLFELLRKQSGGKTLDVTYLPKDERYVECTVTMPNLHVNQQEADLLFTPTINNIPYLLCRQIVRDHGEATNLRGCAIRAERVDAHCIIIITLPRKKSTNT